MSRGQMSLAVKCPAVKCHCGQMSRGQMSRGQMSLAVKCPAVKCHCGQMSQNLEVVKSLWSNVPWSNETVVIGDPIILGSYHDNLLMKNEKNNFFVFSILKFFEFMSFEVNFLKRVGRNSKNTLLGLQ